MDTKLCFSQHHIVLFPFMSKGHTIPLLHLAHLLLRHRNNNNNNHITLTIFTTPANRTFIADFLSDTTAATIITLPFPQDIHPHIPPGVESTDNLSSMSLFPSFALSTKLMQPAFERALASLPPVSFMVSDGFLWWTLDSANKFGFPRFVFFGMSMYCSSVCKAVGESGLLFGPKSDDELITVPPFPWIKVTRNDFEPPFTDPEPKGPLADLSMKSIFAFIKSHGMIVNSFYELEAIFADHCTKASEPKPWLVGPLCLAELPMLVQHENHIIPTWIQWLDEKLDEGQNVLYVAFGSQAEISQEQLKEIANGLEESNVNFLWVTRKEVQDIVDGLFEERVKGRGLIVKEWVDQRDILAHQSVQGFLSHCGWNSVLESICANVPILAWPMMAEQPINARMVVEEIKVGLRVETCDGSVRGFVKKDGLKRMVKQLMEGEMGQQVRNNVQEFADKAKKALEQGTGSSWHTLDLLLKETCKA